MTLPNAENAFIEEQKLTDYLLNLNHKVGFSKAKFFRARGYDESNIQRLESELLKLAIQNEVSEIERTDFGAKYVILGEIDTPSGQKATLRTVWQIRNGEEYPRFITAYPET